MMVKPISQAQGYAWSLHIFFYGKKVPIPHMSIIMLIKAILLPAKQILIQSSCGAIQIAIIFTYILAFFNSNNKVVRQTKLSPTQPYHIFLLFAKLAQDFLQNVPFICKIR